MEPDKIPAELKALTVSDGCSTEKIMKEFAGEQFIQKMHILNKSLDNYWTSVKIIDGELNLYIIQLYQVTMLIFIYSYFNIAIVMELLSHANIILYMWHAAYPARLNVYLW